MEFSFLHIFIIFLVGIIGASHGALTSQEYYWKSMLPDTPMPNAIKQLLQPGKQEDNETTNTVGALRPSWCYKCVGSVEQVKKNRIATLFFLENDLKQGTNVNLQLTKSYGVAKHTIFLDHVVANSIPFTSKAVPDIFKHFSIKPDSVEAKIMKQTINECESKANEGEVKYCATSLESMIDFCTAELGKKVKAISTIVTPKESDSFQRYNINRVKKLTGGDVVVCHKQNYAYAVFYCHKTRKVTKTYMISLVGSKEGSSAQAVAVCHMDTKAWNTKHVAFQTLKVKPGIPICHFLTDDLILWMHY